MKKILIKYYMIICKLSTMGLIKLSDEKYLKYKYYSRFGKKLHLSSPQTFNEKLQWLKLYDRKDIYSTMVDKDAAKKYVAEKIDKKYIIPSIGVYDNFDSIDFDSLPNKFVMKCTHNSGGVIIVDDKSTININEIRKKMNKTLKRNYYLFGREWPYKNVPHKIIIEKHMGNKLIDYKFFCFNGNIETILVCSNRKAGFKNTDFYDTKWNKMPFTRARHCGNPDGNEKPKKLDEMIEIAKVLSKGMPFIRVDLYEIDGAIYFGELTFFPSSGFEGFNPSKYDTILGDLLKLPRKSNND